MSKIDRNDGKACHRGHHFWAAENGWKCLDCPRWRWDIAKQHPDYRPAPSWAVMPKEKK